MKKGCRTESSARQCGVWLRSPASALVESVVKPRVPHRGFSKILWKPASFAGFHRIGTFHSAPCFGILPTTNSEFPIFHGRLGPLGGQNVHKMVKFREAQANAG